VCNNAMYVCQLSPGTKLRTSPSIVAVIQELTSIISSGIC